MTPDPNLQPGETDEDRVRRLNEHYKSRALADEAHVGPGPAAPEAQLGVAFWWLVDKIRGRKK